MKEFGTNHGWFLGKILNNGPGSIVDKDTAHTPLFHSGLELVILIGRYLVVNFD